MRRYLNWSNEYAVHLNSMNTKLTCGVESSHASIVVDVWVHICKHPMSVASSCFLSFMLQSYGKPARSCISVVILIVLLKFNIL